jgi:glutathione peroxidase-family protein
MWPANVASPPRFVLHWAASLRTQAAVVEMYCCGDVLLFIVASETGAWSCIPQYKGLGELHDKYKSQGFEVLAFPCEYMVY